MNSEGSLLKEESLPHLSIILSQPPEEEYQSAASSFEKLSGQGSGTIGAGTVAALRKSGSSFESLYCFNRDFLNIELEELIGGLWLDKEEILIGSLDVDLPNEQCWSSHPYSSHLAHVFNQQLHLPFIPFPDLSHHFLLC
jgi:hypothetical protein